MPPSDSDERSGEDVFADALRNLLGESSIMVTGWMTVFEYVDESGEVQLVAFSSEMPEWRLAGIVDTGYQMLIEDEEYEDDD